MGGESEGSLGWDGGVSFDDVSHLTVGSLDTSGKWCNIKNLNFLGLLAALTEEDGSLDGGAVRDSLVCDDGLIKRLIFKHILQLRLKLWDSGGTTDEDDLVDASFGDAGVLYDLLY